MSSHQRKPSKPAPTALDRLHKLRKQAAKELGLPITDYRVARLALWQGAFNSAQIRIAAGNYVAPAELKEIDDALREARNVPEDTKIIVEFIDRPVGSPPSDGAINGEAVKPKTISWSELRAAGRTGIKTLSESEVMSRAKAKALADAEAQRLQPLVVETQAAEVSPAENSEPVAAAEPVAAPPKPKPAPPMTPEQRNRQFHEGSGLVHDVWSAGRFMGLVRKPSQQGTIYEPWPNPSRVQS